MAITFVGGGSRIFSAHGNATINLTRPAGMIDGDFMVCVAKKSNSTTFTAPPGWTTEYTSSFGGSSNYVFAVLSRHVATVSTEPETYTLTWGDSNGFGEAFVLAYRGVDSESPFATAAPSSAYETAVIPAITVDVDDAVLILAIGANDSIVTGPSVMTRRDTNTTTKVFYDQVLTGAGSTGSRTMAAVSSGARLYMTALRPAGDGPPPVTAKPWSYAQVIE